MATAVDEARAGVRAWVRHAAGRTRAALRTATPYGIVAVLAASAVAPIAGAALGAPAEFAAALNQLGGRRLKDLTGPGGPQIRGRLAISPDGTVFAPTAEPRNVLPLKLDGGGP
jgi:hypothetical protein